MMKKTNSKRLFATILLLFGIGTGAFAFGYWCVSYPRAIPNSGVITFLSMGVLFISYVWAFLLTLKWRDERSRNTIKTNAAQPPTLSQQNLEGTIYGLTAECRYQIVKSFTDYYNNSFKEGDILHFRERHFLPYHGGHTIIFEEQSLYLQENLNAEILDNFSEYIVKFKE